MNEIVKTLLISSKNSAPYFPPQFSKKLCEEEGVECNENVFFQLISNIVDYKLDECVKTVKSNLVGGASKKQTKDITFKTIDV